MIHFLPHIYYHHTFGVSQPIVLNKYLFSPMCSSNMDEHNFIEHKHTTLIIFTQTFVFDILCIDLKLTRWQEDCILLFNIFIALQKNKTFLPICIPKICK
jgi:hypothetical protein